MDTKIVILVLRSSVFTGNVQFAHKLYSLQILCSEFCNAVHSRKHLRFNFQLALSLYLNIYCFIKQTK
jgi:hypothetical protein